jgi:hypothetical protein
MCDKCNNGCNNGCKNPCVETPTPYVTNSTCNSGCSEVINSKCVIPEKWVSVSESDYGTNNVISPTGSNTLFKIEKLKYRVTRFKLELQGRLEFTAGYTPLGAITEHKMLTDVFIAKCGLNPLRNTLQLRNLLIKYDTGTGFNFFPGYLTVKPDGIYYTHYSTSFAGLNPSNVVAGQKVEINMVFHNDYDLI